MLILWREAVGAEMFTEQLLLHLLHGNSTSLYCLLSLPTTSFGMKNVPNPSWRQVIAAASVSKFYILIVSNSTLFSILIRSPFYVQFLYTDVVNCGTQVCHTLSNPSCGILYPMSVMDLPAKSLQSNTQH